MNLAPGFDHCSVCGAPGAGQHYGGKVCSCCRIFFLRQTRRGTIVKCKVEGLCVIRPGAHDNCQSCRYVRCLQQGMRPQNVGKNLLASASKSHVVPFLSEEQICSQLLEIRMLFSAGFHIVNSLETAPCAMTVARNLLDLERFCFNSEFDWSNDELEFGDDLYSKVDVSLADVVMNSQACSTRSMRILGAWRVRSEQQYSLTQTHCRGTTMYADFLTAAPEIHALTGLDKLSGCT